MVVSMERWSGKVAIVTGASAGIGAEVCKNLVEHGLKVVGFARRSETVEGLASSLKGKKGALYACKVDITKEDDIKNGFKWVLDNIGPVSILINNAGVIANTNLTSGETDLWRKVLDTNIMGLCIATREAYQIMKENNIDGHIVHINSMAGHRINNLPNTNVYQASKYAVTALTANLRNELVSLGSKIKISSISPGVVKTEFAEAAGYELPPDFLEKLPYLKPEDIADAVEYALSTPPSVQIHELMIAPLGSTY